MFLLETEDFRLAWMAAGLGALHDHENSQFTLRTIGFNFGGEGGSIDTGQRL